MKAYVFVGTSACGKTLYARGIDATLIERDELRRKMGVDDVRGIGYYEKQVTRQQLRLLHAQSQKGNDVCISDTNLCKKWRDKLCAFLERIGYTVTLVVFPTTPDKMLEVNQRRTRPLPLEVIQYQWDMYKSFLAEEPRPNTEYRIVK